jgi:hypothetical protein
MTVFREADAAELLDVRRGGWALSDIRSLARELPAEIEAARDRSSLPEGPDREAANRLVVEIYRSAYRSGA